jgi:hypothetical protein
VRLWRRKRKPYALFLFVAAGVEMIGAAASPPLPEPNLPDDPPSGYVNLVSLTNNAPAVTGAAPASANLTPAMVTVEAVPLDPRPTQSR